MTRLNLAVFACIAWLVLVAAASAGKPTRSECTIGFRVDWTNVVTQHNLVHNEMFDLLRTTKTTSLAAMGFDESSSRLYMLFKSDCGKKREMAADLIDFWHSKGLDLPTFERIPDPIIHSPSTIDVRGPHWSDGGY